MRQVSMRSVPRNLLLGADVPEECIILEDRSTYTLENVTFALAEIKKRLDDEKIETMLLAAKWLYAAVVS